tara:strand:+ start:49 stop:318 length:270 start_codon:yes stop_codon:yes gene_type:complete
MITDLKAAVRYGKLVAFCDNGGLHSQAIDVLIGMTTLTEKMAALFLDIGKIECGFIRGNNREEFLTRREAARLIGQTGELESCGYFSSL